MPGFKRRYRRFMPVTPGELRRTVSTRGNAKNRGVPRRRRREDVMDSGFNQFFDFILKKG